ncbi:MAG: hypothetical protein CME19_01300 [Gemmatimonadetes bacterium]|nr:hypothetical protein [Gemmatimonadota bacterium]|tara:strand:- start:1554 stop:1757 length:204 start_codon:yes stop_codon:yes gene_type:complete
MPNLQRQSNSFIGGSIMKQSLMTLVADVLIGTVGSSLYFAESAAETDQKVEASPNLTTRLPDLPPFL